VIVPVVLVVILLILMLLLRSVLSVREETAHHGTRVGVTRGLTVTGSVITSAGIVLAATFAALGIIPLLFLAQLAFIVAFGVLLDTIVVRSLLVPALVHDLGPVVWWPSKLARPRPEDRADREGAEPATVEA
jgi:RND superfamily putative drug exporter